MPELIIVGVVLVVIQIIVHILTLEVFLFMLISGFAIQGLILLISRITEMSCTKIYFCLIGIVVSILVVSHVARKCKSAPDEGRKPTLEERFQQILQDEQRETQT